MLKSLRKHFDYIMKPKKQSIILQNVFYSLSFGSDIFCLDQIFLCLEICLDGAKKHIVQEISSNPRTKDNENLPPPKRFKFLEKHESGILAQKSLIDIELSQYICELGSNRPDVTASRFWLSRKSHYPTF